MNNLRDNSKNPYFAMGCIIRKMREKLFPGRGGQKECAEKLGTTSQEMSVWERGKAKPGRPMLKKMAKLFDLSEQAILNGDVGENEVENLDPKALARLLFPTDSRRMNVHKRVRDGDPWWESSIQTWHIRGEMAANAKQGIVVDDTGYDEDVIEPPAGLTLVRAKGESMSPLILDGQYAMIDKQREGFEVQGGIVVVVTLGNDGEYETRIKRCRVKEDNYEFSSINKKDNPSFLYPIEKCKIWPVIGVWFAGQGIPPKE